MHTTPSENSAPLRHPRPTRSLFAPLPMLVDDLPGSADAGECDGPTAGPASCGDPVGLPPLVDRPRTYVCPGEKHAIPRSIHLARLAAFYPNCRQCEHRHDTGQLPRSKVGRLEQSAQRVEPVSPFRGEGIRGPYLNQLTRQSAARLTTAVADRLWATKPHVGCIDSAGENFPPSSPRRAAVLTVVIGQDSRTSSPDLCVGVSESLRRMGCSVVDVGRVSRPCLTFAVDHLQAEAGLYVTGSGCPGSWTGIDVIGRGGIPWSAGGTLDDIERRYQQRVPRPTRQGGSQRYFDAAVPYRASLLKHFQELRPLRVLCSCAEPTLFDALVPLFEGLPCDLIPHVRPQQNAKEAANQSTQMASLGTALGQSAADYGVLIGEDGASLTLFGRDPRPFPSADVLRRVLADCRSPQAAAVVVGANVDEACRAVVSDLGYAIVDVGCGAEPLARIMQDKGAPIGVQAGGRIWFSDAFPRCDAAITLGRLLHSLSQHG